MSAALASSVVAPGRRAACMLGLVCVPLAAGAQLHVDLLGRELAPADPPAADAAAPGWTMASTQSVAVAALARPAAVAGWQPSSVATQTMLWARRARLGVGVGVEQRWAPVGGLQAGLVPPARDAGVLVGVSWATGESSQLTWAAPVLVPRPVDGLAWTGLERPPEREMRLGLEFRKRDPYAELRRGALMKLEISRDTTLSLKPRHGRVGFTLTSRW